jgi:hypothetical protein
LFFYDHCQHIHCFREGFPHVGYFKSVPAKKDQSTVFLHICEYWSVVNWRGVRGETYLSVYRSVYISTPVILDWNGQDSGLLSVRFRQVSLYFYNNLSALTKQKSGKCDSHNKCCDSILYVSIPTEINRVSSYLWYIQ